MPTIIALDISLSMQRSIPGRSEDNPLTYHQLAQKGISQLLDYLTANSKLEYVSLVTYATTFEIKVDFTREYDQIRQLVKKIEPGDKICLISMLKSVAGILASNWGTQNCQVIVFTDCGMGFGNTSLKTYLNSLMAKEATNEPDWLWINTLKTVKLNFVCMGLHSDRYFTTAVPLYKQLFEVTELKAQMYLPKPPKDTSETSDNHTSNLPASHTSHKSELGRTAMFEMIERVCENFKPHEAILKCGGYFRLECSVILWPAPQPYQSSKTDKMTILQRIEVCGFLSLAEIGSPVSLSRHIILPKVEREKPTRRSSDKSVNSGKMPATPTKQTLDVNAPNYEFEKLEQDIRDFYTKDVKYSDEHIDPESSINRSTSNSPPIDVQKETMCVLLHGALKVENLAALVLLNDNWYGYVYSYADSKKKANLMLNILPPGNNVVPWLGDFRLFGFAKDLIPGEIFQFPVKSDKRSYSQSCVVWIRKVSLQSDIQKVLRHAKKMPEKTQHFYKELNRIRRAALSIGFVELLETMATLFEKESAHLAMSVANPECSLQLKHAAIELRKPMNRDLKVSIAPVQKFGTSPSDPSGAGNSTAAPGFIY